MSRFNTFVILFKRSYDDFATDIDAFAAAQRHTQFADTMWWKHRVDIISGCAMCVWQKWQTKRRKPTSLFIGKWQVMQSQHSNEIDSKSSIIIIIGERFNPCYLSWADGRNLNLTIFAPKARSDKKICKITNEVMTKCFACNRIGCPIILGQIFLDLSNPRLVHDERNRISCWSRLQIVKWCAICERLDAYIWYGTDGAIASTNARFHR